MDLTKIPIIIVNWNGIIDTKECINSLKKMNNDHFHIYLIDNGSSNDEGNQLSCLYKNIENITVFQYENNLGFTKAHIKIWEEVIKFLDVSFIALLNNDTSVDKNWLEELIEYADKKEVDIVSSKMIDYNNRNFMDNAGHKMLNTGEIIPIGFGEPINKYCDPFENLGACAGACLYSTKMIKQIGFFDPFFTTGYEDAEFGLRATIGGYSCRYAPKAIVYHKRGSSIKKIFDIEYSVMIQTCILYSFFKLVPIKNILLSFPSIIVKNLSIVFIDILFQRLKYLYVWRKSWLNLFALRKLVIEKRKEVRKRMEYQIGIFDFSAKTIFFLYVDIKRFWRVIILNKSSALDSY